MRYGSWGIRNRRAFSPQRMIIGTMKGQQEQANFDVEDFGSAFIRFANSASLQLEASWDGFEMEKESFGTRLLGTKGGCHLQGNQDFNITAKVGPSAVE